MLSLKACLFIGILVNESLSPRSRTMWLKVGVGMKILSSLPPTVWLKIIFAWIEILFWSVLFLYACFVLIDDANSVSATATVTVVRRNPRLQADELARNRLLRKNKPSVICITNLVARLDASTIFDVVEVPQGSGSGIVWGKEGYIVTTYHVIHGASKVRVTFDNKTAYDAQVVGFDQDVDVAVLHVDAPKDKLRPIPNGVSSNLREGQNVHAIGHPFGLNHTLSPGVISGLRREISSPVTGRPIRGVIQTDASINPGNSGGPLLDSSGSLIGIITAIHSPSGASCGVAFAIPVDTVSRTVNQLVKVGKVTRPNLGTKFAPDQSVKAGARS